MSDHKQHAVEWLSKKASPNLFTAEELAIEFAQVEKEAKQEAARVARRKAQELGQGTLGRKIGEAIEASNG